MSAGIHDNKFPEFKRAMHEEQRKRLSRAAMIVSREAKQLLSTSGTGMLAGGAKGFKADFGTDRVVPQWGWKSGTNRAGQKFLSRNGTIIVQKLKSNKKSIYGAFPSKPGEPPHKQTGRLRMSVAWEIVTSAVMAARIGTNVVYGKSLQLGTRRMKPRPWLDVALTRSIKQIKAIFIAPFHWTG